MRLLLGFSNTVSTLESRIIVYTRSMYFEKFPRFTVLFGTYTEPLSRRKISTFHLFWGNFLLKFLCTIILFIMDLYIHNLYVPNRRWLSKLFFFFEKSNMHGLLGTYTDYVNLRFSHIHDYLGSTVIRDSREIEEKLIIFIDYYYFYQKIIWSKDYFGQKFILIKRLFWS